MELDGGKGFWVYIHFTILVNGAISGYFRGSRGLHQGDPLSTFLFSWWLVTVSYLIGEGLCKGFQIGSDHVEVSRLLSFRRS